MSKIIFFITTVAVFILSFFTVQTPHAHAQLVNPPYEDANGYTVFTPSLDTRIIYVSSSAGSNSNDGLTTQTPVQTLAYGKSLLRPGYPDWLLLKKGDTWFESLDNLSGGSLVAGRSATEPALISSYGTGTRPLIEINGGWAFGSLADNQFTNYVAIVGLQFYNAQKNPVSPTYDVNAQVSSATMLTGFNWFLIEDNVFRFVSLVLQGDSNKLLQNAQVRKNIFRDAFSVNSFSTCIFTSWTPNLLIEDNFFNNCGWNENVPGAEASVFDRAAYLCCGDGNTVYRGNIDANGASGGVQVRSGGTVEDSLFLRSPIAISLGSGQNPTDANVPGLIRNNVILDARDISGDGRGFGIVLSSNNALTDAQMGGRSWLEDVEVYGNIISTNERGIGNANAISVGGAGRILGLSIRDNIVYDWRDADLGNDLGTALSFTNTATGSRDIFITDNIFQQPRGGSLITMVNYDPTSTSFSGNSYFSTTGEGTGYGNSWFGLYGYGSDFTNYNGWVATTGEIGATRDQVAFVDPDRSIDTYMTSIGIGGGYNEFINRTQQQSRDTYDSRFTSYAVNAYIRAGFALASGTPAPVITLSALPTTITTGSSTTLTWSSTNATSCTASNGWSGSRALSGALVVTPSVTTIYTLTCVGGGGTDVESRTVTVSPSSTSTPEVIPPSTGGGGGGGGGGGSSGSSGTKFKTNQTVILIGAHIVKDLGRKRDLGTQASSSVGTIVSGATKRSDGITYYHVSFVNGLTGWVPATTLALYKNLTTTTIITPPPRIIPPKVAPIVTTTQIETTSRVNVRTIPGGAVLTQIEPGIKGIIDTNISPVVKDGYTWVYAYFGTTSGYVAREFLRPQGTTLNNIAVLQQQIQLLMTEVQRLMQLLAQRQGR